MPDFLEVPVAGTMTRVKTYPAKVTTYPLDKPMEPLDGSERILVASHLRAEAERTKALAAKVTAQIGTEDEMPRAAFHAQNLFDLADVYVRVADKMDIR
jgi:hypothetical protein